MGTITNNLLYIRREGKEEIYNLIKVLISFRLKKIKVVVHLLYVLVLLTDHPLLI